jgi:hypothetical protein
MKTELRLAAHLQTPGANVIEIWYGDRLIATVTGADGPGVRIISKHRLIAVTPGNQLPGVQFIEVMVGP